MFEQILNLPIEKKIGQLFFIGLSGAELDVGSTSLLKQIAPGGVCLFARNIKSINQLRTFLDAIRTTVDIEPLLSLDQEGGVVDRLRRILAPMSSASSIKTTSEARTAAKITAEIIRILGFNMNFAPVVDVIDENRGKFHNGLYSRSFGNSTEQVVQLAGAYLDSLQKNGCLGCIKHFPGLGASKVDSHEELPLLNISKQELFEIDLPPYREIISQSRSVAVMVAHAGFPEIDLQEKDSNGKFVPSSLSFNFTTKLLREELNFKGVGITDDLEMGAILKNYGIEDACKMAITAGADMLAICADPDAVRKGFEAVYQSVRSGEISESRIDESLRRIAHLKSLIQKPLPFSESRLNTLSNEISEFNKTLSHGG